jgi:hypothetical protein
MGILFVVGLPDAVRVGDDTVALRLENLEALTDAALTRLDVDDLLAELLARVREILDVDTASVLMLDTGSRMLVARAASRTRFAKACGFRWASVSPDVSRQRGNRCGWIVLTRRRS